jgi:hypothetical protein
MSGFIAELFYDKRRAMWRWIRGNETFYNERNELIEFSTSEEAVEWIEREHPEMTAVIPKGSQQTMDFNTKGDT